MYDFIWTQYINIESICTYMNNNQTLKATFNNVFTLKNLSYMSLHAFSVFDKV